MISTVQKKYEALAPLLHEKARRCWAASEALALGRGGISLVAAATQLSRPTIRRGIAELEAGGNDDANPDPNHPRIRQPGGGRHSITVTDRTLICDLQQLIDPVTRGDPMSPLRWTCKSTAKLAEELRARAMPSARDGRPAAPRAGLQPPGQPQDDGGRRSPGP